MFQNHVATRMGLWTVGFAALVVSVIAHAQTAEPRPVTGEG